MARMALTCIKWISSLLCGALLAAPAAAQQSADADLVAARDAVQKGRWSVLEQLRARFAGHLLEAYPEYWLLDGNIEHADSGRIQAFLARYPTGPLAENLRRDWLKVLGAQGSWDLFRAEHPKLVYDDADIACYSLQERFARNDASATPEARALFLEGREAPPPCDPVFARLAQRGDVSQADIWERMRKLLAGNHVKEAKRADALLPVERRLPPRSLDAAASHPLRWLHRFRPHVPARAQRELAIFAVARVAASRPDEAADRLAAIDAHLGPDACYAWGQLAYQAALNLHPRALEWYAKAKGCVLTDAQVAWRARSAMRAGDWKEVLASIERLSPQEARTPTWRYWQARALRAEGDAHGADALLRGLVPLPTFYGLLAAEDLGVPDTPDWNGFRPSPDEVDRIRAFPGIRRALALYRVGLDNEALGEWTWATRGLDDRGLLAAAQIAAEAGVPDRAIFTADRTLQLHDFAQRYPVPHRDAMDSASRQWDLDEAFVYGIIRQESRFLPQARSPAGAVGLMQLMPATARWIARQIPVTRFRPEMLVRPDVNVAMGSYYLHRVLTALGDPILAAAAYNAGPARARRWRADKPLEGAIFAETIPFPETREYVKKVFANAWYYRHRLTGSAASLRQLLGTVPGRAAGDSLASNIP